VYIIIYGITLERKGLQQCSKNVSLYKGERKSITCWENGKMEKNKSKINQKE
jgi:hypothetical protein